MLQLFRLFESRPLRYTLAIFLVTLVTYVIILWLGFPYLPVGSGVGFMLLLLPMGLTVLTSLWATGATVRNVLRHLAPWYYLILALGVLLSVLGVGVMVFYFFVFALFGFA